jgi:hypothetical protein
MTNTMSDKPIAENGWDSMNRNAPVYYHDDGPIGTAISRMGADVHLDIDRVPSGSEARLWLDRAIEDMDAPEQSVPAVPDITPEPIVTLIADLNAIPIVRKNPAKELNPLVEVANDFAEGRTLGSQMIARVRDLRNRRHESLGDCGKFTIDDAIDRAVTALENMPRSELRPPQG